MDPFVAGIGCLVVFYSIYTIYTNASRIQNKFRLDQVVQLEDLTKYSNGYSVHDNASLVDNKAHGSTYNIYATKRKVGDAV